MAIDRCFFQKVPRGQEDGSQGLRIAVVGSDLAGLACAWLLHPKHAVSVFAPPTDVHGDDLALPVPMHPGAHPNLTNLLRLLNLPTEKADMRLSLRDDAHPFESSGAFPRALFRRRRALLRPSHWTILRDLTRFLRDAPRFLTSGDPRRTLRDFAREQGYHPAFVHRYLVPVGASLWPGDPKGLLDVSAKPLFRLEKDFGLLSMFARPKGYAVTGGKKALLDRLSEGFRPQLRLHQRVQSIERSKRGVHLRFQGGDHQRFDRVILATPSDEALQLLDAPSEPEETALRGFTLKRSEAVFHTDTGFLPRRKRHWAGRNCLIGKGGDVTVTYFLNRLEGLGTKEPQLMTFNPPAPIAEDKALRRMTYAHAPLTLETRDAQHSLQGLNGQRHTYFAGAHLRYGFLEDGLQSALSVAEHFGIQP